MTRTHTKLGPVRGICLILALIGNLTTVPVLFAALNRWHSGAVFVLATMLGCASTAPVVDVDPNRGLAPVEVETYSLVVERMPGFLVPFMRDDLVAALAARGAEEVGSGGDVEFRLVFEQVTLLERDVPAPRDKFEGTIAPEEASRPLRRLSRP